VLEGTRIRVAKSHDLAVTQTIEGTRSYSLCILWQGKNSL
jgi:hypothetical protein